MQRSPRGVLTSGSEVLFPYPKQAGSKSVVICNYSGKKYFWGKSGQGDKAIEDVKKGEECTTIPLEETCSDSVCWHRGWVSPCRSQSCFKGSAREVNAGIDVVNSGGGKGVCTVICTAGKDLCKTNTVVFIAPMHCTYVQVVHSALSIVDFPAPYQNLPKITFPYPRPALDGTSIYICNYSGDEYFFSTNDKDRQSWMDSPGHAFIKPITHGEACTLIKTSVSSWRRGFIAPCKQDRKDCFTERAQEVHAGVNVVNSAGAGQALCTIECAAMADVCKTATVVMISPAHCDKVHVATM